jgi:cytochrome P450
MGRNVVAAHSILHGRDALSLKPAFLESVEQSLEGESVAARLATGNLCILDAVEARRIESANFANSPMPERMFAGSGDVVLWRDIRREVQGRFARMLTEEFVRDYHARLRDALLQGDQTETDLTRHIVHQVCQSAIPFVFSEFDEQRHHILIEDQQSKIAGFLPSGEVPRHRLASIWQQVSAGFCVRRLLKARRGQNYSSGDDGAQAVLDFGNALTKGQAAYACMTLLTALAGAPGASGACLAFELARRPAVQGAIREEMAALDDHTFFAAPVRSAPYTARVVREVMRLWPFPLVTSRLARAECAVADDRIAPGDIYHLSAYFTHRMSTAWDRPEDFDPSRWESTSRPNTQYVPFGWSARSCPGASLGLMQMMVLARIFACDIELKLVQKPEMGLFGTPLPANFTGTMVPRA